MSEVNTPKHVAPWDAAARVETQGKDAFRVECPAISDRIRQGCPQLPGTAGVLGNKHRPIVPEGIQGARGSAGDPSARKRFLLDPFVSFLHRTEQHSRTRHDADAGGEALLLSESTTSRIPMDGSPGKHWPRGSEYEPTVTDCDQTGEVAPDVVQVHTDRAKNPLVPVIFRVVALFPCFGKIIGAHSRDLFSSMDGWCNVLPAWAPVKSTQARIITGLLTAARAVSI